MRWRDLPPDAPLPVTPLLRPVRATPHFLIVHLFSGRRRVADFHWHLDDMARRMQIQVTVLSLDTAVSGYYGNLEITSTTWSRLCTLYEQKWIAGTLTGPPCETFSEARFTELPDQDQGPRPLRSHEQLYTASNIFEVVNTNSSLWGASSFCRAAQPWFTTSSMAVSLWANTQPHQLTAPGLQSGDLY